MATSLKETRDVEICRLYRQGTKVSEIHRMFGISSQRVRQILRENGVARLRPVREARRNYLGITISDANKEQLRSEARDRGVSMSSIIADLIRQKLEKAG